MDPAAQSTASLIQLAPIPKWLSEQFHEPETRPTPNVVNGEWAAQYAWQEAETDWLDKRVAVDGTRQHTSFTRGLRLWELGVERDEAISILTWFLEQGVLPDEGAEVCARGIIGRLYDNGEGARHKPFGTEQPPAPLTLAETRAVMRLLAFCASSPRMTSV